MDASAWAKITKRQSRDEKSGGVARQVAGGSNRALASRVGDGMTQATGCGGNPLLLNVIAAAGSLLICIPPP